MAGKLFDLQKEGTTQHRSPFTELLHQDIILKLFIIEIQKVSLKINVDSRSLKKMQPFSKYKNLLRLLRKNKTKTNDRPFHNFRQSTSGDQGILCNPELSDGFFNYKVVKESVGEVGKMSFELFCWHIKSAFCDFSIRH